VILLSRHALRVSYHGPMASVETPPPQIPASAAAPIDRAFVIERCKNLVDFQLWPPDIEGRIEPWLDNFNGDETETALHLLNSFVFISEALVAQLFLAAFHNLSAINRMHGASFLPARSSWQHFFDTLIVTYVTGEVPNPADSGYIFARLARDKLEIREPQIVNPQEAIRSLIAIPNRPVLFVDDFVGSGQQFISTWIRQYPTGSGSTTSFQQLAARRLSADFYYCPAVCTEYGADKIRRECAGVTLSPGNFLSSQYSCFHADSLIWPPTIRPAAVGHLERASRRAGIPNTGGVGDWRGFHQLGLCVAFHHKTPDATIPLFYWERNNWRPLVRHP
jgi:hypothetical protein